MSLTSLHPRPPLLHYGVLVTVALLTMPAWVTARAEPVHYTLDPNHSFVNTEVRHFNTSTVRTRFNDVKGYVDLDDNKGKTEISIPTASISSGIADFDQHLKSQDFLNVSRFSSATFTSSEFHFDKNKLMAVQGMLTLLGKERPVSLKAIHFNCYDSPVLKKEVCGGDFEATIKRSEWGMTWGLDMGIPDEVKLLIQIEAAKQ